MNMTIEPGEMLRLTLDELARRGRTPPLPTLAGFVFGKQLSAYAYLNTPQSLANSWEKCDVEAKARTAIAAALRGPTP